MERENISSTKDSDGEKTSSNLLADLTTVEWSLSDFYYAGETNPYLDVFPGLEAEYNREAPDIPSNAVNGEPCGQLLSESNDEDRHGLLSWTKKRIEDWKSTDAINWLFSVGSKLGLDYGDMPPGLALPGKELLLLRKKYFVNHFGSSGEKVYNSLRTRHRTQGSKQSRVWEFPRNLLMNPEHCPRLIRWDNYEKKRFRIIDSKGVAKLWGEHKNNKNMTWEKLSRALRHWYQAGVIQAVRGRPLVFEFKENATGLETDNPNFEKPNFHRGVVGSEELIS